MTTICTTGVCQLHVVILTAVLSYANAGALLEGNCAAQPCKNGGQCLDCAVSSTCFRPNATFECNCSGTWNGLTCEDTCTHSMFVFELSDDFPLGSCYVPVLNPPLSCTDWGEGETGGDRRHILYSGTSDLNKYINLIDVTIQPGFVLCVISPIKGRKDQWSTQLGIIHGQGLDKIATSLSIVDVPDPPDLEGPLELSIPEKTPEWTTVINVVDIDPNDVHTFSSQDLPDEFTLDADSGQLSLKVALDSSTQKNYTFHIKVTDQADLTDEATVFVTVVPSGPACEESAKKTVNLDFPTDREMFNVLEFCSNLDTYTRTATLIRTSDVVNVDSTGAVTLKNPLSQSTQVSFVVQISAVKQLEIHFFQFTVAISFTENRLGGPCFSACHDPHSTCSSESNLCQCEPGFQEVEELQELNTALCIAVAWCPTDIANVQFAASCTGFVDLSCSYSCPSGYTSGTETKETTCLPSRSWDRDNLCAKFPEWCPAEIPNGDFSGECNGAVDSRCTYSCDAGYLRDPSVTEVTCLMSRSWDQDTTELCSTSCSGNTYGVDCSGSCDCVAEYVQSAEQMCDHVNGSCDCRSGRTGRRCEIEIDACAGSHTCDRVTEVCENTVDGYTCACVPGYSRVDGSCIADVQPVFCPGSADNRGQQWERTLAGETATKPCATGYSGAITRQCQDSGVFKEAVYNCTKESLQNLQTQIKEGTETPTTVLVTLKAITADELFVGDLLATEEILQEVVQASSSDTVTDQDTEEVISIADNLLGEVNNNAWGTLKEEGGGVMDLLDIVSNFTDLVNATTQKTFQKPNLVVALGCSSQNADLVFPPKDGSLPDWATNTNSGLQLPSSAITGKNVDRCSATMYRRLTDIAPTRLELDGQLTSAPQSLYENVMTVKLQPKPETLEQPLQLDFQTNNETQAFNKFTCGFWKPSAAGGKGAWSTTGCRLKQQTTDAITCECDHLTNFALLMSIGGTPSAHRTALGIISAVGCTLSILCLIFTVVLHFAVWRLVKSERAVLLMHLCVALMVGYIVFLAGIDRTENEVVCTVIAAVLQFIYLLVFFLMLAEGINIGISVVYVFASKLSVKWLIASAYILPLVIVGVSLGVTKTEGFGNEDFCWLSTKSGLIWAFVGPACFVILVNLIIIAVVIHKMRTVDVMKKKSKKSKLKVSLRSLCVLMPIMGIAWVLGIFSVNEQLVAFQYLFAIFNSLQGLAIFVFHCALNKQLRQAFRARRARRRTLESFDAAFQSDGTRTSSTGERKSSKSGLYGHRPSSSSYAEPTSDDGQGQMNNSFIGNRHRDSDL